MIKKQAETIRTVESEDLEGELARRLLLEIRRPRSKIRNWEAFLKWLLPKKADNWIRDWRERWEDRKVVLPKSQGEDAQKDPIESLLDKRNLHSIRNVEENVMLEQFWREVDPTLRRMCELLAQKPKLSQADVAKLLGVSRTTVSRWLRKVREKFKSPDIR